MQLMTVILLLLPLTAYAGEAVIVETDSAITVEYTGSPSSMEANATTPQTVRANATSSTPADPARQTRTRFLAAQIKQLQREAAEILRQSGNETDEELAAKSAQAAEKKAKTDAYAEEYQNLTGKEPDLTEQVPAALAAATPTTQLRNQRVERGERIRRTRELRRSQAPPAGDSQ